MASASRNGNYTPNDSEGMHAPLSKIKRVKLNNASMGSSLILGLDLPWAGEMRISFQYIHFGLEA